MNYFTERDFQRANPPCKLSDMQDHFLRKLDAAREIAGVPFIVSSAYRTEEHEKNQGRDGSSSHCKGIAVDLKAANSRTRFKIIEGLLKAGFTRLGCGENYIHVDLDHEKDQEVAWHYYPKNETGRSMGI